MLQYTCAVRYDTIKQLVGLPFLIHQPTTFTRAQNVYFSGGRSRRANTCCATITALTVATTICAITLVATMVSYDCSYCFCIHYCLRKQSYTVTGYSFGSWLLACGPLAHDRSLASSAYISPVLLYITLYVPYIMLYCLQIRILPYMTLYMPCIIVMEKDKDHGTYTKPARYIIVSIGTQVNVWVSKFRGPFLEALS